MIMRVIGVQYLSFPDRQDASKTVTGVKLYGAYPLKNGDGFGYPKEGLSVFVSEWLLKNRLQGVLPTVGKDVDVRYNRNGKVEDIVEVEPATA